MPPRTARPRRAAITSTWTPSVTLDPGETSKSITVDSTGDATAEPDESFFVQLYDVQGANLDQRFGRAVIQNDDAAAPVASIADGTPNPTGEGSAVSFAVTLSSTPTPPVTIHYATMPGCYDSTATVGSDYTYVESTITFAPGETSKTILVPTLTDGVPEPTEKFWVQIYNPVDATVNPTQRYGAGFIADAG